MTVKYLIFILTLTCALANPCPPMASHDGITVSTSQQLRDAVNSATEGQTILLADGTYNINSLIINTPGITLRSASGNADNVILDGNYQGGDIVNIRSENVTIAEMTIKRSYYHPVHVAGGGHYAKLYGLKLIDARQQFVKVNPDGSQMNDFGEVACTYFELTDEGRNHVDTVATGCYTGGIDMHQAWGWTVRDNEFHDIYCTSGLSEHAIHFWSTSRDPVIERNKIYNCARGIGLGLGSSGNHRTYPDDPASGLVVGHIGGIIKNNYIYSDIPFYDTGIALEQAWNVTVAHNTIMGIDGNSWNSAIDSRFENTDALLVNNLYYPKKTVRNNANPTEISNMLADPNMFSSEYHLKENSVPIDQGTAGYATLDIDLQPRNLPDIGADEFDSGYEPPDCVPVEEICDNGIDEDCDGQDPVCSCGIADTDSDNVVSISELIDFVDTWKTGSTSIENLITAINKWKAGC